MGCLNVSVREIASHMKISVSKVCSVKSEKTFISLFDKFGRVLLDSKGRKLITRK